MVLSIIPVKSVITSLNSINMKSKIIYVLMVALIVVSCNSNKKESIQVNENSEKFVMLQNSEGYDLLKTKCYACHNPNTVSHDAVIAPPMAAIKKRYSRMYDSKEEFVNAVTDWAMNPLEENAIMRGAVMQFKVMPKQVFDKEELQKIANYMYENELEKPEWFEAHEKEMHGNGKGRGKGNGRGNGRGMGHGRS